jgi:hypothetical protein
MLSVRNLFSRDRDFEPALAEANIRTHTPDASPKCRLRSSPAARRGLALVTAISGLDLDDFIELRFERFCRVHGDSLGAHQFHAKYCPPNVWNTRPSIEALIYDEMCDWLRDDVPRDKEQAAKALGMLAACRWKARNIDPALSAADKALFAYRLANREYGDLFLMCRGIMGIGYMYWGLDATDLLTQAATIEDRLDAMLESQFSTFILDGLAICHKRLGRRKQASELARFADQHRLESDHIAAFTPSWGVRTPPWMEGRDDGR